MAIVNLFMDGFDQYTRGEQPAELANFMRFADYTVSGSATIVDGRLIYDAAGKAIMLNRSSVSRSYNWTQDVLTVGVAVKFSDRGGLLSVSTGGANVAIWTDRATGLVNMLGLQGYVMPVKDRWYYLEVEIDRVAGEARVYLNGKLDITAPLPVDISAASVATIILNPYTIPPNSGNPDVQDAANKYYDDLYINSDVRLSPVQVTTRFPSSSIQSDWNTTSDEGEPNWSMSAGNPLAPLDRFLYVNADGATESYFSNKPVFNTPVVAIGMVSLVRKATPNPMTLVQFIDAQEVSTAAIGPLYTYRFAVMDATGYNAASVQASNFGIRLEL